MHRIVVANWKMNPSSAKIAKRIFVDTLKGVKGVKGVQVVVCPPTIYLSELSKERKSAKVQLGVQDVSHEQSGAYTGQVSVDMIKGYRATYAILGHSERRAIGETNEYVGEKVRATIRSGVTAVLCVGEWERNEEGAHFTFVRNQLEAVFSGLKRVELARLVIAYEPIWAIGKTADEAMSGRELFEMCLYIRKLLIERFGRNSAAQVAVLYGGSVKADNAASLVTDGGVDGLLVGGASLNPKEFIGIVRTVSTVPAR